MDIDKLIELLNKCKNEDSYREVFILKKRVGDRYYAEELVTVLLDVENEKIVLVPIDI